MTNQYNKRYENTIHQVKLYDDKVKDTDLPAEGLSNMQLIC